LPRTVEADVVTRAYLSIGDVLTLLREEFPDVTISKIRFLESQGLVNPERSPSGYRKFYEQDVERLRWVLRQQREHFLPLKVIRDRLAQEDGEPVDDAGPPEAIAALLRPATSPVIDERAGHGNGVEPAAQLVHAQAGADMAPATRTAPEVATPAPVAPPHAAQREPAVASTSNAPVRASAEREAARSSAGGSERPTEARPAAATANAAAAPRRQPLPPPTQPEPTTSSPARPAPALSGASMTLSELCSASGLDAAGIASLEGFGLIEGVPVGGVLCYDEEALVVAKLVAEFGRYGIEPRHLRLYRNAVEREVGLIEQIVTPLLRQRNPEARQRAVDATGDLARLGEGLRSSLLRREMRRLLGH
jgi:DNA-binding transcriptional MerR regulator